MRLRSLSLVALLVPATLMAADEPEFLQTDAQKFSYGIGLQIGQSLKRQGVELDIEAFAQAVFDAQQGNPPLIKPEELQKVMEMQQQKIQDKQQNQAQTSQQRGQAFLKENRTRDGVNETSSGLQYRIIKAGQGKKPAATDTVVVHYTGKLLDGREFDSSHRRGEPATLPLSNVVKGWQEALPMMREGGKWELYIPSDLAYGSRGAGGVIGPNETLIFEIELIEVK